LHFLPHKTALRLALSPRSGHICRRAPALVLALHAVPGGVADSVNKVRERALLGGRVGVGAAVQTLRKLVERLAHAHERAARLVEPGAQRESERLVAAGHERRNHKVISRCCPGR
jgi:hypothetical protein